MKTKKVTKRKPAGPRPGRYGIAFSAVQVEEIQSLPGRFFETVTNASRLTRVKWLAIAYMCLGKAERIDGGAFGADDNPGDSERWAADLRSIATEIFEQFGPGDGKI